MKTVPLNAYPRTLTRRPGNKKLRSGGLVPAIIYGRQGPPQDLQVKQKELEDLIHEAASENMLLDLSIDGDSRPKRLVLVKEVQHHPLTGAFLHLDLHEVSATEKVTISVPVESLGESVGVKTNGGVLEHVLFKVRVRGLPKDLPEVIQVDVTSLEIGQSIHVGDLKAAPGVEILGDKSLSVISVAAPITEAQETAALEAEATAAGEVEMIKEKKEGEGEEAGAAAPAGKGAAGKAPAGKAPVGKPGEKPAAPGAKPGEKTAPAAAGKAPGAEKAPEKKAERKK